MRVRRLLLMVSLLAAAVAVAPPVAAKAPATGAESVPSGGTSVRPEHAGSSDDISGSPTEQHSSLQPALRQRVQSTTQSSITVEVVISQSSAAQAAAAVGGTVVREYDGLALVTVPRAQVERLATQPGVTQVRLPTDMRQVMARAQPPRIELGEIRSTFGENARAFVGPGEGGVGQKVGIIGLFDAAVLAQQVSAGELSPVPAANTTCISGGALCPFGTPGADFGNAIAEVVTDAAPFATLFLAELGGGTDYLAVVDWMAANGVTTLVHYWTSPFDGPGDGTGFSASVVDYAVSKGILWVNAAGEQASDPIYNRFAGPYWRSTWADGDNDRWLNFSGSDETLTAYCGSLMGLRWNDWGAAKTDYDLYISDFRADSNTHGTRVLASAFDQGLGGAAPIEANDFRWLCNDNPARGPVYDTNGDKFVSLSVFRTPRTSHSPVGDVIEISLINGWLEYSNNPASIAVPFADTKSTGALVIGAVEGGSSVPLWYSSRGPTNDGRIAPHFAAASCIATSRPAFNIFEHDDCLDGLESTAGPAATVAGFAAVLSPRQAVFRPVDRARYLLDLVKQFGQGVSNERGWGSLNGTPAIDPATSTSFAGKLMLLPAPVRVLETRAHLGLIGTSAAGPVAANTSIRLNLNNQPVNVGDVALFNVTLVQPPALGWVQSYPPLMSWVGASSNLNVAAVGETVPNLVAVRVDQGRSVSIYTSGSGHMVVDLLGTFNPQNLPLTSQGRYVGIDPYQVANTVGCIGIPAGCTGAPVVANTAITVPLAGTSTPGQPSNGIPTTGNYAAVVSVTATPGATSGWASALPGTSTGTPSTSTLNFVAGRPVTSMAIVPLTDANGSMRIYTSASAHFRVDVLGYFRIPTSDDDQGGLFVAPGPTRLRDTRLGGGAPVPAGGTTSFSLGAAGAWSGSSDVWLNVTSTGATGAGQMQVSATSATPAGNHVNVSISGAGRTVASAAISRLDARTGVVRTSGSTHVIVDLVGWFTPSEPAVQPGQIDHITRANGTPIGPNVGLAGVSTDENILLVTGTVDDPSVLPGSKLTRWDRTTDSVVSVDATTSGAVFDATGSLSGDGNTVFLSTMASGVVPADGDAARDLFARAPDGALEMLSVSTAEEQTNYFLYFMGASHDGNLVLMNSAGSPVPGWGEGSFYLRDRAAGTTISVQSLLPSAARGSMVDARLSADGTRVIALVGEEFGYSDKARVIYRLAFVSLNGGQHTVLPFGIHNIDNPIQFPRFSDATPDGSHVVVAHWMVGVDGSFTELPSTWLWSTSQISDDRLVAVRVPTTSGGVPSEAFIVGAAPQRYFRTDQGVTPFNPPAFVHLVGDGSGVYFASDTTLIAAEPGTGGRIYLYHLVS